MNRYAVGIDLGTTHCILSAIDLSLSDGEKVAQQVQAIPQLVNVGAIDERFVLPSFIYLPHPDELNPQELTLPWVTQTEVITGEFARQLGVTTPIRLISSAKSWLCHAGADCRAPFLPLDAPEEINKLSPLQASVHYLRYLHQVWDFAHPDHPLAEQSLTITIPASFDPAARELTAEAMQLAGMGHAVLLEEPQAALYNWIQSTQGDWRKQVNVGDVILVVDMGGGTTDFSLIIVTENDGNLILNRVAVGDHILLGGDNMDLALAYVLKAKLAKEGKQLENWQIQALTHGCRIAKESLLADTNLDNVPVIVPSRGSRLIGGTLRTELTRDEVTQTLVNGFFPDIPISARPVSRARTALTQLGLPYAQDAGVTRHLANFLSRQIDAITEYNGYTAPANSQFIHPSAILLNGGVFKAQALTNRLLQVINSWLSAENAEPVRMLTGSDLDLAVGQGAAYYSYVRQGHGVRIRGGLANAYYVGIEGSMPAVPGLEPPIEALCVAPFGMEEGSSAELPPQEFGLVVGEAVRFRFFGSSVRRDDHVGTLLESWNEEELVELPEIEANLPAEGRKTGEVVPVRLNARVNELGILCLEAIPRTGSERWQVEFSVREK
ncbi:molecular chaperone [Beggiatoa alba B18LD]|uniref:Molecular chaperone n=1 Tax=Beggiatoa alba B18LD TaxID=395493 RepID=I3CJ09_9GAMM|nr:Hsp70 family protein [Beggiatoa alba]EIJ43602.1 molecular chaperone [Beggiatoa alba B18LD]